MLGKTATTSDLNLKLWKGTLFPPIPIKEVYVGNKIYEVNNGFTERKL